MAGNNKGNKKGRRKRAESVKDKITNGYGYGSSSEACSPKVKDDDISKLQDLNQILLKEINRLRSEKDILAENLRSEIEAEKKMKDELKEAERDLRKEVAKKEEEHEAAISKAGAQLQEAEHEIYVKESECAALIFDKKKLEASVLHLKDEIQVISTDSDARRKDWELEKNELLSQVSAAREETEAISKGSQIAEQAWNADKENLLSSLCRFEKEVEEMSKEKERVLFQCRAEKNELKSELSETKGRTEELLGKYEQDRHLWDAEKRNSESTLAELQTRLELTARERKLLNHINEDLSSEVLSLKDQLKGYNYKLVCMEEGRQMLKAMSASNAERLEAMTTQKATMENEIKHLQRQVNEAFNQHSDLEEKHSQLLNEKEEQGLLNQSMQAEIASLRSERSLLSKSLNETTARISQELSEKCLRNDELQTELAAAKLAYDQVTVQFKKMREDMNKISNDSHRIQREKEALDEKLMLEISRNSALEEELLSRKSSIEMKESAANLATAHEKGSQIFIIEERSSKLMDANENPKSTTVNQKSKRNGKNETPKPKGANMNRKPAPKGMPAK